MNVDCLLNSPYRFYFAIAGGGTGAIQTLTENGGASGVFIGAVIHYDFDELSQYIGYSPEKACSEHVAKSLAERAAWTVLCRVDNGKCIGIGATSVLSKRCGEHKIFVTVLSTNFQYTYKLTLKPFRARHIEERIASDFILWCVMKTLQLTNFSFIGSLHPDDSLEIVEQYRKTETSGYL